MVKDFFRYIIFHKFNKLNQYHFDFAERSGFKPKGLHLIIYNYIKKLNKCI